MKRDPTIMNMIKNQTLPGLESCTGCMSTPVMSTHIYISPAHPSVVVNMKRLLIALVMSSKLESLLDQLPPPSKQSYFVMTVTFVPSSKS